MADRPYRVVTACRLCDSAKLSTALYLGETPLANELDGTELFPLVVNRCDDCGHHQLSIAVAPERLWGPNYPYQSGTSPVFRKHLEALADEVAALKPGGLALEIAANDGTLVRALRTRGLEVFGLDPSSSSSDVIRASWPYKQMSYKWPYQPFMNGRLADVILALNVFAHVDDLHSFTAAVKEALAPDGVFIVEVGYLPDVIERGLFDVVYHEHLSYHHFAPLVGFFKRHGLGIQRMEHVDSQGGSMRFYVEHIDGAALREDFDEPDASSLRETIDTRSAALREAFAKLTQRGETIAIYGAPAKLTTLLYATGLDKVPFVCVGDNNPRKIGRTTPGNHIPIVSVGEMLARKPDSILLAAWNFADDICKRLREAGYKGGIINPMSHRA
jgi:SAM-dependent methyltransferase